MKNQALNFYKELRKLENYTKPNFFSTLATKFFSAKNAPTLIQIYVRANTSKLTCLRVKMLCVGSSITLYYKYT